MQNSIWDDFKMQVLQSSSNLNKIIALNVGMFIIFGLTELIFKIGGANNFITPWLTFPSNPMSLLFKPWTVITYQFMHLNFFHIFFNMAYLLFVGRLFAEYLGEKKLVFLYLAGGVFGAFFYMAAFQFLPMFAMYRDGGELLGASASIMAILSAVGTLLPDYTIRMMFIGNVKMKYLALGLLVLDIISISFSNPGGSISHIGGFVFGFIYIKSLQNGRDLGAWVEPLANIFKSKTGGGIRNKSYIPPRMKVNVNTSNSKQGTGKNNQNNENSFSGNVSQKDVDSILDKISKSGYDSLSSKEKQILFEASKK